ncbi:MAG: hypothetical protein ACRDGM_10505, partial [bacterium]
IIGAHHADAAGNAKGEAGESYVVLGGDFLGKVMFAGTADNDEFTGTAAAEVFVGGQGDDTMTGGGGADAFQGGAGDDSVIAGPGLPLDVDGGSGIDTVNLDAVDAVDGVIDLSGLDAARFRDIEKIDLSGMIDNTLMLDLQSVLDMAGTNGDAFGDNLILVKGDVGDQVTLIDIWTAGTTQIDPLGEIGDFATYTNGAATLLVDTDILIT